MTRDEDEVQRAHGAFADSLDVLMRNAEKKLPADRMLVLRRSAEKLQSTFEKASYHLHLFLDQYDRLSKPTGPRGPATVHRLRPRRKR